MISDSFVIIDLAGINYNKRDLFKKFNYVFKDFIYLKVTENKTKN